MEKLLELGPFLWFVVLVFPGLISMHVYRLFMPAKDIDWKNAIFEGFFYSALNFSLCWPILAWLFILGNPSIHPYRTAGAIFFIISNWPHYLAVALG